MGEVEEGGETFMHFDYNWVNSEVQLSQLERSLASSTPLVLLTISGSGGALHGRVTFIQKFLDGG